MLVQEQTIFDLLTNHTARWRSVFIPWCHSWQHPLIYLYPRKSLMIPTMCGHQQMSMPHAAKTIVIGTESLGLEKKVSISLVMKSICHVFHLIYGDHAYNIWIPERRWCIHIIVPRNQLKSNLLKDSCNWNNKGRKCQYQYITEWVFYFYLVAQTTENGKLP